MAVLTSSTVSSLYSSNSFFLSSKDINKGSGLLSYASSSSISPEVRVSSTAPAGSSSASFFKYSSASFCLSSIILSISSSLKPSFSASILKPSSCCSLTYQSGSLEERNFACSGILSKSSSKSSSSPMNPPSLLSISLILSKSSSDIKSLLLGFEGRGFIPDRTSSTYLSASFKSVGESTLIASIFFFVCSSYFKNSINASCCFLLVSSSSPFFLT
mmetsp:Transcript_29529/g.62693  ORF Transcript_29529/g.62693 Transcript_29529/m.62693 type:complete len:216 (-) Transcript_29529:2224-2871(-)